MPKITLGKHRGEYVAVITEEDGTRRRRLLGAESLQDAKTRLGEFKRTFSLVTQPDLKTVAYIFDEYLKDREAAGVVASGRIKDAGKALKPFFGHMMPNHITKKDCTEYTDKRRAAGRKDGTIHTELTYLRAAMKFGLDEKLLTEKPYIMVPQKPDPKDNFLSRKEAKHLIDCAVMPHAKLFIIVALNTAGRMQAILDLTWDRVNFIKRQINLRDPDKDRTAKGRAIVPMNDTLFAALTEAKNGALTDYVIEYGGEKVGNVKKAVAAAAKRAGIQCTAHDLRRTAAVWMAQKRVPMRDIALFLGHTNTTTTERVYAKHHPDFLTDAAKALEG